MKALEKAWDLNNDSIIMKRAWRSLSGEEVGPTELKVDSTDIIIHKRAKTGVHFEKPNFDFAIEFNEKREEAMRRHKEYFNPNTHQVSAAVKRQIQEQADFFRADEIPACEESSTKRLPLRPPPEMQKQQWREVKIPKKQKVLDLLILPHYAPRELESLATSYGEAFGAGTEISFYQPGSGDTVSVHVDRAGVKCLPFRVRVTGKTRFLHYGKDALMNFDNKPKGILHPVIARRLREFY